MLASELRLMCVLAHPDDESLGTGGALAKCAAEGMGTYLVTAVEKSGEAFLSNAVIGGRFVLRACVVNFHTSLGDVEALPPLLSRLGREADTALRQKQVAAATPSSQRRRSRT